VNIDQQTTFTKDRSFQTTTIPLNRALFLHYFTNIFYGATVMFILKMEFHDEAPLIKKITRQMCTSNKAIKKFVAENHHDTHS